MICLSPMLFVVNNDLDSSGHPTYTVCVKTIRNRELIQLALARAGKGSGSNLDLLRERSPDYGTAFSVPDLGEIRYLIVGGLAVSQYMPMRMTLDTDILIAKYDLAETERFLDADGCAKQGDLSIDGGTWRMQTGRLLDVIALDSEWVADALNTPLFTTKGKPYISLPFLVLMKLESGRLQDLADISRMLGFAESGRIEETKRVVAQYRPEDSEGLENMILLGRLEHEDA
jgi:hypothetical protein